MAEVTVKSELVIRLCDEAIEKEKNSFEDKLPRLEALEKCEEDYDLMRLKFCIPFNRAYPFHEETLKLQKTITKLTSIKSLALLSESITINDEDMELLATSI